MRSIIVNSRAKSRLLFLFALLWLCIWFFLMQVEFVNCIFKSKRDNTVQENCLMELYADHYEPKQINVFIETLESRNIGIQSAIIKTTCFYSEQGLYSNTNTYFLQSVYYGDYNINLLKGYPLDYHSNGVLTPSGINVSIGDIIDINGVSLFVTGKNTMPDYFWVEKNDFRVDDNHFCVIINFKQPISDKITKSFIEQSAEDLFESASIVLNVSDSLHLIIQNLVAILFLSILSVFGSFLGEHFYIKHISNDNSYVFILLLAILPGIISSLIFFLTYSLLFKQIYVSTKEILLVTFLVSICHLIGVAVSLLIHSKNEKASTKRRKIIKVIVFVSSIVLSSTTIIGTIISINGYLKHKELLSVMNNRLGNRIALYYIPDWLDDFYGKANTEEKIVNLNGISCVKGVLFSGLYTEDNKIEGVFVSDYSNDLFAEDKYIPIFSTTTSRPTLEIIMQKKNTVNAKVFSSIDCDTIIYDLSFLVIMNEDSNEVEQYLMSTGSVIEFETIINNSNKDASDNANKNVLLYITMIMLAMILFLHSKTIIKEEKNETI